MEHGHAYGLCKKIIAAGKMSKETLIEKFNVLLMSGGLTDSDYIEVVGLVNAKYASDEPADENPTE